MVHLRNVIVLLIALMLSFFSAYSVLSYDGQTYTYFINNVDPTINITLKSFDEAFEIKNAQIMSISDDLYEVPINEQYLAEDQANHILDLSSFKKNQVSFLSSVSLKNNDFFNFNLNVEAEDGSEPQTQGVPTSFTIRVDNEDPEFIFPDGLSNYVAPLESPEVTFSFSEPLQYLKISQDDEIFYEKQVYGSFENDFINDISFFVENISEGLHTYDAVLIDRAGNEVETSVSILLQGSPLEVSLLTRANDSLLSYYYNPDYKELFGRAIYTQDQDFELKLKTSKPSTCYLINSLSDRTDISQKSLQGWLEHVGGDYEEFTTQNNLDHSYSFSISPSSSNPFLVGCQNKFNSQDYYFLSEALTGKKEMLEMKYYDEDYSMTVESPGPIVAQKEVYFQVSTSKDAFCEVNLAGGDFSLTGSDFLKHSKTITFEDGTYSTTYSCYDKIYQKKEEKKELKVDKNAGLDIMFTSDNYYEGIYYSISSSVEVNFTTAQEPNECRFSTEEIVAEDSEQFNSINKIDSTVSASQFSFTSNTLLPESNNTHYIYCEGQQGLITKEELTIFYDTLGPQLSQLRYNNAGVESQEYISSVSSMNAVFNVDSVIPIESFEVTFLGNNTSEKLSLGNSKSNRNYSKDLRINQDISSFSKIVIIGKTILGTTSDPLQGNFKLDVSPPEITLSQLGGDWKITCTDSQSGCAKSWIGVGDTQESCSPTQLYSQNLSLNTTGYSYVCAKAQNYAGVESSIETKETGYVPLSGQEDNVSFFDDEQNQSNESNETQEESQEEPFEPEPFEPQPEEESDTPFYILTAVLVVFAFGGAGGWYAYKKGYLDEQLKKMGIPTKKNSSQNQKNRSTQTTNKTPQKVVPKLVSKKSKYDKHLNRLNKFLDDALDSKQDVYDSFGGSQKGKVKGYKDSMHSKSDKDSAFDEFYKASNKKDSESVEEVSDKFEHYYSKKKQNNKK